MTSVTSTHVRQLITGYSSALKDQKPLASGGTCLHMCAPTCTPMLQCTIKVDKNKSFLKLKVKEMKQHKGDNLNRDFVSH